MKIKLTFDREDLKQLVAEHLRTKGIKVDAATMTLKGSVKVTVEVDGAEIDEETPSSDTAQDVATPAAHKTLAVEPAPVDMKELRAASAALKDQKPGMFGEPAKSTLTGAMSEEEAKAFFASGGGRPSGR